MGKNKNKGFDLAKRQEKILKRMAKPLYKKSDKSTYFVITQPFGMHPSPAARGTVDVDRLASWISWVFRRESVIMEAAYTMSTRDEIIVRIAEGADPTRILGKHKYKSILKAGWPYDPSPVSCVFVYDYQSNGDPSDHNWREHVPSDVDAPPDHFRNPYPTPTWVVRPSYLSDLTLTLPNTLARSPRRSPEPLEKTRGNTRREEAKQEPARSFHNTDNAASELKSHSSRGKLEPSGPTDSSITRRDPAYEPSQALRDQIALLNASHSQAGVRVEQEPVSQIKHEPDDSAPTRFRSETYDAPKTSVGAPSLGVKQEPQGVQDREPVAGLSQVLWDEWARYQSNLQRLDDPVVRVKQEPYAPQSVAQIPITQSPRTASGSFDFVSRGPLPLIKKKKNERGPETDEAVQPWKRPKTELN